MTAAADRDPEPATQLGPDWVRGADGVLFRSAARVILLDRADRVLLVRGHDLDRPERSWWFTVGGGIDPGEDSRDAAVRELREETGIVLHRSELVGPVFRRSAVFDFFREHCRQDEEIFLARVGVVAGDPVAVGDDAPTVVGMSRAGWTAVEVEALDEVRWWDLDRLAEVELEVFPEGFVDLVRPLLAGWDGVTRDLGLGG